MIFASVALAGSGKPAGSVSGCLTDASNGRPLIDAWVVIIETNQGSRTDSTGCFSINNVAPGTYHLSVIHSAAGSFKGLPELTVTGVSGGGKNHTPTFHFPNMNENVLPYAVGSHRHTPEMEQIATAVAGKPVTILFQPHVGPFDRGILSSVYCTPTTQLPQNQLIELYQSFYRSEPFVRVLSTPPAVKHVAHTNYCHVYPAVSKGRIVCFSAIDNLVKGAAGQAVQNLNLLYGLDETLALI